MLSYNARWRSDVDLVATQNTISWSRSQLPCLSPPGVPVPRDTRAVTNTPMPGALTPHRVQIAHHHLRQVAVQWGVMRYVFVGCFYEVRNWWLGYW
jgi:hypothetical protein